MTHTQPGTIDRIGPIQMKGRSGSFPVQKIAVRVDEDNVVPFEAAGDITKKTAGLNVGDSVEVQFTLRGWEYNGKLYVSAKVENIRANAQPSAGDGVTASQGQDDDLPF